MLESFLEKIFLLLFNITSNYGISIILLSLAVTIIMFPLYVFAELLQRKEHNRKGYMQSDLNELKDLKNKQEKYLVIG